MKWGKAAQAKVEQKCGAYSEFQTKCKFIT